MRWRAQRATMPVPHATSSTRLPGSTKSSTRSVAHSCANAGTTRCSQADGESTMSVRSKRRYARVYRRTSGGVRHQRAINASNNCVLSRGASEHGAGGEPGATGIIEVEESSDELTRREETRERRSVFADHASIRIDMQPAERERDPARDAVRFEWRRVEASRPVRLVDGEAACAPTVFDRRIERRR